MNLYEILAYGKKDKITGYYPKLSTIKESGSIKTNNYFLEIDDIPCIPVAGEYHYSRDFTDNWENEIVKMKMSGITVISTYLFWNIHEPVQGCYDFTGNKDIHRFIGICQKHGLNVIIRIGPYCHGEVRNGGLPDWLYGQPFIVRSNDAGYIELARKLFMQYGNECSEFMYSKNGPVIGIQIENEYQAASSPWEEYRSHSDAWIPSGDGGVLHMKNLMGFAIEAGLDAPLFTCTGWDNAPFPEGEMLPLYGAYSQYPWLITYGQDIHPLTTDYLFTNYHDNNDASKFDISFSYENEKYPFACCEMGGGMQCWYADRFVIRPESVDSMCIQKIGSGCNLIGYYMYHGGINPKIDGKFMNEHTCPQISYDFQAPLGEYGQIREHYRRLKRIHSFLHDFGKRLAPMAVYTDENAHSLKPENSESLRYSVRSDGDSGFVFILNYQDHSVIRPVRDVAVSIRTSQDNCLIPPEGTMDIDPGVSCILPFGMNLGNCTIRSASAQPLTEIEYEDETYFFFFIPKGIKGYYDLITDGEITTDYCRIVKTGFSSSLIKTPAGERSLISVKTDMQTTHIVSLTDEDSLNFWTIDHKNQKCAIISSSTIMDFGQGRIIIEHGGSDTICADIFPCDFTIDNSYKKDGIFNRFIKNFNSGKNAAIIPKVISEDKMIIYFNQNDFDGLSDLFIDIEYEGDVGRAFINGELISDNFNNGQIWEIGLKAYKERAIAHGLCIAISSSAARQHKSANKMAAVKVDGNSTAIIKNIGFRQIYRHECRLQTYTPA